MMESAILIALCVAFMALFGLVYVALFMRTDEDQPTRKPHQKQHYKRWEDKL